MKRYLLSLMALLFILPGYAIETWMGSFKMPFYGDKEYRIIPTRLKKDSVYTYGLDIVGEVYSSGTNTAITIFADDIPPFQASLDSVKSKWEKYNKYCHDNHIEYMAVRLPIEELSLSTTEQDFDGVEYRYYSSNKRTGHWRFEYDKGKPRMILTFYFKTNPHKYITSTNSTNPLNFNGQKGAAVIEQTAKICFTFTSPEEIDALMKYLDPALIEEYFMHFDAIREL